MDRNTHLAHLRRDAATLLDAAGRGLDAPVPSCPGWNVERLVGHVGRVYRSVAGWATTGAPAEVERPPAGGAVVEWAAAGLEELIPLLGAGSPDDTDDPDAAVVTTWAGPQPASFWPRRMAIETALHRWDAEDAHGVARPVDADLAVDAIDELFDVLIPVRVPAEALTGDGESLHLHATDVPGEWLVTLTSGAPIVERTHAKGTVAVRGSASDLLLLLWNRASRSDVEVFGDEALLDRWSSAVSI